MLVENTLLHKRYRITRLLGKGGFGAVYEAIDETFGEPIALKEIHLLTKLTNEKQRNHIIKAFRRESKALAKARHETIPFVRDYFSEDDRQFLVMELVEGDELAELLEKNKIPFPLEDVLDWTHQLLDALDYLHTLSPPIFHRDIKPQNLKLTSRGRIKLLDFGIAKVVESETQINLAQQTLMAATRDYSPIEQLLHAIEPMSREYFLLKYTDRTEKILKQKTDARCDIYALGATLYHLLTNRVPVESIKRCSEIWEGKNDPMPNPSEINPDIPSEISDFLLKAMAVERENRFESAIEMQEALQEIISSKKRREAEEEKRQIWNAEQEKIKLEREKLRAEQQEHLNQLEEKRKLVETERLEHLKQIEKERLQKEEERKNFSDLTQAETAVLLETDEPNQTEKMILSNTLPAVTESSNIQPSDTFSFDETSTDDYKDLDTDFLINKTSDSLPEEKFFSQQTKSETRRYIPTLPIIGILAFAIFGGGIYGIISIMNYSENTGEINSVIENANTETTPEVTPTVEANLNISEENTNIKTISETNISVEPKENNSKPTVQPTRKPLIKTTPEPVSTPKPVIKKTPKPNPTKRVTADDLMNDN